MKPRVEAAVVAAPGASRREWAKRRTRWRAGLARSARENAGAFAFSITITSAFGAVSVLEAAPSAGDMFLFAGGAVTGFAAITLVAEWVDDPEEEPERTGVVLFAALISYFSVLGGVGAAALVSWAGTGWYVWLVAPFAACVTYLLVNGLEYTLAEEEEGETDG